MELNSLFGEEFEIKVSDTEKYYALTITERDKIIEEKIGNRRYEVHRLKG